MPNPIKAVKTVKSITKGKEKVKRQFGPIDNILEVHNAKSTYKNNKFYKLKTVIEDNKGVRKNVYENKPILGDRGKPLKIKPRKLIKTAKRTMPTNKQRLEMWSSHHQKSTNKVPIKRRGK
jgi:hypothetical protein